MTASIKSTVYRDVKACGLVGGYGSFVGTCFFNFQGRILSSLTYQRYVMFIGPCIILIFE